MAQQAIAQHGGGLWVTSKKYWYLTSLLLPAVPLMSAWLAVRFDNGAWLWLTLAVFYLLLPLVDTLFGRDHSNPDDEQVRALQNDRYFVQVLYGATLMHWLALLGMAYTVAGWDWPWYHVLGAALSAGIINGVALVAGHELGHKRRDRIQQWAAKIILACSGYGHFTIEHNRGHHKWVSTPEDPASARFGESLYKFTRREIPGAWQRAWRLEKERLNNAGHNHWTINNEILQPALMTIAAYALIIFWLGPLMIPFLLIAAVFAWWQVTAANYVEHYGLLREKNATGGYQRCRPEHSWNSNYKISNLVLLHLQRHSDHHAYPSRPYQVLRDYKNVPQLPHGYPGMFVLAMLPAAWFAVMNPRVTAWTGVDPRRINLDPDRGLVMLGKGNQVQAKQ